MFEFVTRMLRKRGRYVGTHRTHDAAFTFRMPTGFAGTVNRTHPASIEPCLQDANAPVTAYGVGVLADAASEGVRPVATSDTTITTLYGVSARPFPAQQTTGGMSSSLGAAAPPANQPLDVLKSGYILVRLPNFAAANSAKGSAVYVWAAASAGNHVQGTFEASATSGSTVAISNAYFNGPAGPDGVAELAFNL